MTMQHAPAAGRAPRSGSRARSRDIGYGQAMLDVLGVARALQDGPIPAEEALDSLARYAYAAWLTLAGEPRLDPGKLAWWGNWDGHR